MNVHSYNKILPYFTNREINQYTNPLIMIDAGIVSTQVHMIFVTICHLTALTRFAAPTPIIAPVIVCVVEAGIPIAAVPNKVIAPAVSAQNPPMGFNGVKLCPMVFTTFHPPIRVPNPITV